MTTVSQRPIVLIQPPCSLELPGESVLWTQFDSVGLLALAAFLESRGYSVQVLHFARALAQGYSQEQLFQRLGQLNPIVIGLSMNWLHLSVGALQIAAMVKQRHPGATVVVGGQHASLFAGEIMRSCAHIVDGVAVGEGEETLLEIVERAGAGAPLSGIAGLVTSQHGQITYQPRQATIALDALPLISYRSVFPAPQAGEPSSRLAALSTTRGGCRRDCNYCLESCSLGRGSRGGSVHHSPQRLVEQVRAFVDEGRDWITVQDPFCTHGDRPMQEFIQELIRARVRLRHLSVFLEPGCFEQQTFDLMEQLPAAEVQLSFGLETGSPAVAQNLGRCHDYDRIQQELAYLTGKHFIVSSWWMVGLPGEGPAEVALTRRMIVETMRLGVYAKWVTPLILFPQTGLAGSSAKFGLRPLLRTFEDFCRFSRVARNQYGVYPELITHESDAQSAEATLGHLVDLKTTIEQHQGLVDVRNHGKQHVTAFEQFQRASLF